VKFEQLLLQVSATMPRGFKKIKLSGPRKVNRMRDDDPPLYQQQIANSEHGDEAVHDHAIEGYPADEGVGAAGAEDQPSDTDDMFRPIDLYQCPGALGSQKKSTCTVLLAQIPGPGDRQAATDMQVSPSHNGGHRPE
jgi:hypothetical protein